MAIYERWDCPQKSLDKVQGILDRAKGNETRELMVNIMSTCNNWRMV